MRVTDKFGYPMFGSGRVLVVPEIIGYPNQSDTRRAFGYPDIFGRFVGQSEQIPKIPVQEKSVKTLKA